jgi:predicted amidohydrolase YtcJ
LNPFRSLIRARVPVSFGSDCLPPSPLHGLACLSRHPVASERLDLREGLPLYRMGSPWESPRVLEIGAQADLVAIDSPSLEELPSGTIRAVWVGGDAAPRLTT